MLGAIRLAQARAVPHPGRFVPPARAASFVEFGERLRAVGGEAIGPLPAARLVTELTRLCAAWAGGGRILAAGRAAERLSGSSFERVGESADPHGFEDAAVAVLEGSHGIAESAAVLLEHRAAPVRALAFLCERLVLLLPHHRVLPDLHAALDELGPRAFDQPHLTWISGPSKTADIEQALVHGAHGPRALVVVGIQE
jgi:L-lactate dehydrogenase complex protein LldG